MCRITSRPVPSPAGSPSWTTSAPLPVTAMTRRWTGFASAETSTAATFRANSRDPRLQDLLHVLVSLVVFAAGNVGVRQLVDEDDLRLARQDGLDVHLLQDLSLVVDFPARDDLEISDLRGRLRAAVRLDEAGDDIDAACLHRARVLEHLVGLADSGSVADVELELAPACLLDQPQEDVRRRTLRRFARAEGAGSVGHGCSQKTAAAEAIRSA